MTNDSELAREAASKLATLRDELKLKAHLAGMDAHKAWDQEVLPRLDTLESELKRSVDEARVQMHLGSLELQTRWGELEPKLLDVVDKVRAQDGEKVRELFDSAKQALGLGAANDEKSGEA